MIWMVLLMGLPVWGLILFAIYPWQVALVPYIILVAISGIFDGFMMRFMHMPQIAGHGGLAGPNAAVLHWHGDEGQVKWRGEIWRARTSDGKAPVPGEPVVIDNISGLLLFVKSAQGIRKRPVMPSSE